MISIGWKEYKLGEVCTVIAGQSPESKYYNNAGNGMPFYQGKKEFTNRYIGETTVWTTNVTKVAQKGDILMSVRAPVGPINYATQTCCIGRGLASIRNSELLSQDFLFYFLLNIQDKISGHEGAVFGSISKTEIENLQIIIPSLSEQLRIVDKLDTLFADIEKEKQIVQQNLQNSKELFESELHKLFTENTDGWEEKQLGEICNIAIGKTPSRGAKAFWDTELQTNNTWLSIADLNSAKNKIVDTSTERISNKALPLMTLVSKGTLLLSFKLTIGRLAFAGKDLYTNEAIAQLPIKDGVQIDKYYLYYYLSAFDYETLLKGDVKVKGKSLNKQKLNVLPVSYPSLTEQRRVVEKLDALHEQTQELEQIYTQQIADLDELKQAILKKAFNGEL